jgi:hypothetical protein
LAAGGLRGKPFSLATFSSFVGAVSLQSDFVGSLQKFRPPEAVKTGCALHPVGRCDLQLSLLFFKTTPVLKIVRQNRMDCR